MTLKGAEALKKCGRIFIEEYTSFPYELAPEFQGRCEKADRKMVEEGNLVELAKTQDIAVLVPGDPLFATTHLALAREAAEAGVKWEAVHAPSVINAVARTGLSPYKFGRIITISENFESDREKLQLNLENRLHTICLLDPGLDMQQALKILADFGLKKPVVACQKLGMKGEKIRYGTPEQLASEDFSEKPLCFLVPSKLHFFEEEFLEQFRCT